MRANIQTAKLSEAVGKLLPVISGRSILPITKYILANFAEGKMKMTATNMESAVCVELEATHDEAFSLILSPQMLNHFLKVKAPDSLQITVENNRITLERLNLGKVSFWANGRPEDFPPIPKWNDSPWTTLDAKFFLQMSRIAMPAMSKEETRPVLTGVSVNDGELAAADGFRLVAIKNPQLNFGLGNFSTIIPGRTLAIMQKIFFRKEQIEISFNTSECGTVPGVEPRKGIDCFYMRSGGILLTSQVRMGTFPDYRKLIPSEYKCKANFSAPLMAQRLSMIDEHVLGSGIVRLIFSRLPDGGPDDGKCQIAAIVSDEEMNYEMDMPVKLEGVYESPAKIAFNIKYLKDLLRHFSTCSVEITNPSSAGKFTGDLEGVTVVVMPMFVQW